MGQFEKDCDDIDYKEWEAQKEEHPLSPGGIAKQNDHLLRRYRNFHRAADAVTAAWQGHTEVARVALIGSLAAAPWKEVPRS